MSTTVLCPPSPFPVFADLRSLVEPLLQRPDLELLAPPIPTLPWPPTASIRNFNMEKIMLASEIGTAQILTTLKAFVEPLAGVIPGSLESLIPSIPVFNINLLDLIPGPVDFSGVLQKIKGMAGSFPPEFPNFNVVFSTVPEPLYPQIGAPDLSTIQIFQVIIKSYMAALVIRITSMVNQVLSILSIGGSFSIPSLPSLSTIVDAVKAQIAALTGSSVSSFKDLLAGLSAMTTNLKNTLSNSEGGFGGIELPFSFSGFPGITIPLPVTPGTNQPDFDFVEIVKNIYSDLVTALMKRIYDFVTTVGGGFPGFSFPRFCVPVLTV